MPLTQIFCIRGDSSPERHADPIPHESQQVGPLVHASRLSSSQALWLVASMVASFLAASSAPSPLYALYREAWASRR